MKKLNHGFSRRLIDFLNNMLAGVENKLKNFKNKIKKFIPRKLLFLYHGLVNYFFSLITNFPSKKIITIGITGTKGKTTTTYLAYNILQSLGIKTCLISSDYLAIKNDIKENPERLTMPGRGYIHRFLKKAVNQGCEIAIIEVTSEGLMQNRHWGLDFDIAVFLNLHPEHIEHHGSFLAYRNAKGKLFQALSKSKTRKSFRNISIKKTIIVNSNDPESDYFLSFPAEKKITYGLTTTINSMHLKPEKVKFTSKGTSFDLSDIKFQTNLLGKINLLNTLAVLAILKALEIPLKSAVKPLKEFKGMPGRLEVYQHKGAKIIIDYAHTPDSLEEVCKLVLEIFKPKKLLLLIGAAGGIRDKWKRPVMGEKGIMYANELVITNEDPYDEEPISIMRSIEFGVKKYLAEFGIEKPYQIIEDRGKAIEYLIQKAEKRDVVLITGKGNEKEIMTKNGPVSWSDREKVISLIKNPKKVKKRNYSKTSTKTSSQKPKRRA